jgi:hypothetical protein
MLASANSIAVFASSPYSPVSGRGGRGLNGAGAGRGRGRTLRVGKAQRAGDEAIMAATQKQLARRRPE